MTSDLREQLQSTLGDTYTFERELPGGGMSRVFVAQDTSLGRRVVVKVLPPERAASVSHERFRREIQLTAKLQHPHIVTALTAGRAGDVLYYTMPFIDGESLRARLVREGKLPIGDVVRVLRDVLEALGYAHRLGIVHRDIKPENILLVEGQAVVADFGVARALAEPAQSGTDLTTAGTSIGTPAYMAPEQVAADPNVDHRADLYAVGVMAYEMLAGRPPFTGMTAQQVLAAHIYRIPEPISTLRADIPAALAALVMRCLEKHPPDRHASAREALLELDIMATPSGGHEIDSHTAAGWRAIRRVPRIPVIALGLALLAAALWVLNADRVSADYAGSVAVMPFKSVGNDPSAFGMAEALTDQIIDDLAHVTELKVISRTSVDALARAKTLTLPQIAETLHVRHVVQGSLQALSTDSVRVTVQLIDSKRDAHVWSETYVRKRGEIAGLQRDIGRQVAAMLITTVGSSYATSPVSQSNKAGAVAAYLRGKAAISPRTPEALAAAVSALEEAITLDSSYGQAHAQLAAALALTVTYGYRRPNGPYETLGLALAHAEHAVALAPDAAESYNVRGYVSIVGQAPTERIRRDFDRARKLRPNAPDGATWHAALLAREGKHDEALKEARRATELDPFAPGRRIGYSWDALRARRYDEALRQAQRGIELEPTLMLARVLAARTSLLRGDPAACLSLDIGPYLGTRAMCLRAAGQAAASDLLIDSLTRAASQPEMLGPVWSEAIVAQELAIYYAFAGDRDRTLKWLVESFRRSPTGIDARYYESGLFDRVRDDPRFGSTLRRLRSDAWERVLEAQRRADTSLPDMTLRP